MVMVVFMAGHKSLISQSLLHKTMTNLPAHPKTVTRTRGERNYCQPTERHRSNNHPDSIPKYNLDMHVRKVRQLGFSGKYEPEVNTQCHSRENGGQDGEDQDKYSDSVGAQE